MDDRRSLWHIVAVIATLALSVVVAVVAVTRDERGEPAAAESPSPNASPSPAASPTGLPGEGPYVVFVDDVRRLFAFDVSTGDQSLLGTLRDDPVQLRSWQPGTGRVVAFATVGGDIWSITRRGAERIGAIPSEVGTTFIGGAVSPDDRKLAVLAVTGGVGEHEARIVVIDLQSGRPTVIEPPERGEYPRERGLLPIAWSLGGSVLYGIPECEGCSPGLPGLYAYDTASATSTRIAGTDSTVFYQQQAVASPSGQAVYYGNGRPRRCRSDEQSPCEGPPFFLRRLAAGQRGSSVLEQGTDASFEVNAITPDGRLLLVRRRLYEQQGLRYEVYDAEGDRQRALEGVPPAGSTVLALLSRDTAVATRSAGQVSQLVVVMRGEVRTIETEGSTYLGWLR